MIKTAARREGKIWRGGQRVTKMRGRPPLTAHQQAARRRAERERKVHWLENRLDKYVIAAEKCKPGSKGTASWYARADEAREKLRKLDH